MDLYLHFPHMLLKYGTVSLSPMWFFLYSLAQFLQITYKLVFRTPLKVMLIDVLLAEVTAAVLN